MFDIQGKIEEIVEKVQKDKNFADKFQQDPVKAIESIIGIDLPDDQINPLIDGIKAKLTAGNIGDALGGLPKLF
jgi:uncharacterized protein YpuA (DUF1002 family)